MLTPEIPTRKNFGPTKYPREKFWTYEIPTRKIFGLTKYTREKIFGSTKAQWHETPGIYYTPDIYWIKQRKRKKFSKQNKTINKKQN